MPLPLPFGRERDGDGVVDGASKTNQGMESFGRPVVSSTFAKVELSWKFVRTVCTLKPTSVWGDNSDYARLLWGFNKCPTTDIYTLFISQVWAAV